MKNLSDSISYVENKEVIAGGQEVWYREEGEGIPILFIVGWGGSTAQYFSIQNKLAAKGYHVFLPDLPGLPGKTSAALIHLSEWSDWVDEFSRAAIREQFFIVSHSLSAQIALQYASKDNSRCRGVIFLNPWFVSSSCQQLFWRFVARSVRFLCPVIFPDMKWVRDKKAWTTAMELVSTTSKSPKVPCLVLWGRRDPARILLTGWRKIACIKKLFNWDHSPQIRASAELTLVVDEFIKTL